MKNELVDLNPNQTNPYEAEAKDFKAPAGNTEAGGRNQLFRQSDTQVGSRDLEGEADGPAVWGKGGKAFPVSKTGAGDGGTDVKVGCAVNLADGGIEYKGYKPTIVDEVAEDAVMIG